MGKTKAKATHAEAYLADLPDTIRYCVQNGRTHKVTLTRWWTGSTPEVKFFRSAELAAAFVKGERDTRQAEQSLGLGFDEMAQARNAFTKIKPTGKTLTEVVEYYFSHGPGLRSSVKFSEAAKQVLESIAKKSELYVNGQKCQLAVIERETSDMVLTDYTPDFIADYLKKSKQTKEWSNYSLQGYYASFNLLFKYALRHGWIAVNPMADGKLDCIRAEKPEGGPIPYYSVEDSHRLLRAALQNDCLGLLGMISIALFGGVRHEELTKLEWADVHLDDNYIQIRKTIAKNKQSRQIPLNPDSPLCVLKAWLERVENKEGKVFETYNEKKRLAMLFKAADVEKKRNGLRHTMATMHVGAFNIPDTTRKILGQTSQRVLFANYSEDITPSQALPFWQLFPPPLTPAEERRRSYRVVEFGEPEGSTRKYDIKPLKTKAEEAEEAKLAEWMSDRVYPDLGEDIQL